MLHNGNQISSEKNDKNSSKLIVASMFVYVMHVSSSRFAAHSAAGSNGDLIIPSSVAGEWDAPVVT